MRRALSLFDSSIANGTRRSYNTDSRALLSFSRLAEFSPLLNKMPQWYQPGDQLSHELCCVTMFMVHCATMLKLASSTVSNYVAGLRFNLSRLNVATSFVEESVFLTRVRAGMWNVYRATHKEADNKVLPLSTDMLVKRVRLLYGTDSFLH